MTAHPPYLPPLMIDEIVRAALLEDLGRAGDITTAATVASHLTATATMNVRDAGIVVGLDLARAAFRLVDPALTFAALASDGDRVPAGTSIARISGPARGLLSAERVALNFLMHLSGIATTTARYADAISHTRARVCCTRKTLPGLRAVEKYAVRLGGGSNHRFGLDDAILIKDNHIAVCGGVAPAIRAAQAYAGHLVKVEVEVDGLDQMRDALREAPDAILLDNMPPDVLLEAVALNAAHWKLSADLYPTDRRRTRLEASGNVDLGTIAAIAETGVDYISTSKITMAAPTLDIGLDIGIGAD
ncbi:carboxylating nicotinate-nucleotide diphosphorylase [Rhizobium sp. Leaf341]|uniref:carboxylating nicotinate-nucleotide diphosphorylase n=1 Tax=Rhizobium sp. Leaf341 TaxID=1736344 RepID=UPI0007150052|nr:carboxylating nicotinate-nucleotide diphosphorylase [Rhizobium sp. Leaf341]KQR73294.1 nicotinate-nucleotide pyrophosphorylase [Rhizobium sp. Leaf341]